MRLTQWLATHDRGLLALRRACRTAIVMPSMFAIGDKVIGDPVVATFAAFGSFAMLLLVDFGGPMRERIPAQLSLGVTGAVFICLGTLASRNAWLAAAAMTLVGFGVLFSGVISSVLAGASTSLLLSMILPVSLAGPESSIPDRLAGWGMAVGASLLAITLLWPAPARDPLRGLAATACRALAVRLRSDVAHVLGGEDAPAAAEHRDAIEQAGVAVTALHRGFLATPYRPTGLSTSARAVVRLVDEIAWLQGILLQSAPHQVGRPANRAACAVKTAAARVLEHGADLLLAPRGSCEGLRAAVEDLHAALTAMEREATSDLPVERDEERAAEFITSLDPTFRAQELSFAVSQLAANVELAAAAERRSWAQRLLGHQPSGLPSTFSAAQQRAAAHVERNSVWLHNSVRGAIGLGLAVFVANEAGVQHSFWVVLGTLSVLRSNALNTGQNVLRAIAGTAGGFVVGALLLWAIGTDTTLLWYLLPVAILLAGIAPAAISFTAGQAAFTLTVVILFNIIQPDGWRVGLLRVEDVALGCAVSLAVGLLFWPRGAAAALGKALAEAYVDSSAYLNEAVGYGMVRCDFTGSPPVPPTGDADRAAAAARRLDDAFRGYLAERGFKPVPLAEVTGLVNGVVGLRLAADAVLDLWQHDDGTAGGDRTVARRELLLSGEQVRAWYDQLAGSLLGSRVVPEPLPHDQLADSRLVDAVRHDLRGTDGKASATAVRMIWTGDHLDAARRLQLALAGPARTATDQRALRADRLDRLVPGISRLRPR